jgi:lysophospholipid acyltransferase (LPLAT)-like uncharacterized protein
MGPMPPYKLSQRLALLAAPHPASWLLRALALSWRGREIGEARLSSRLPQSEPRIYVTWHESTLAMVGAYRDQKVHPFASRSFDGELISRLAGCMGFSGMARGSSSRGGGQGLLELRSYLEQGEHVYITVDGPRGPRRQAKEGGLKLAQLSGKALVPIAFAARPSLRLRSWDRMLMPPPFCRAVFFFGPEMRIPREAQDLGGHVLALQDALNQCHVDAEQALS